MKLMRPGSSWLAPVLQDLRHGAVLLWRDTRVSWLIVAVLAVGLGGSAAIFTLLKAAFLDPLPYRDGNRLVTVTEANTEKTSASEFAEIRARSRTLDEIAFAEYREMQISGSGEPLRVFAARVTSSFFPLLGVSARIGRVFHADDSQPGRTPAVLVTDAFWRLHMEGDPHAVGRTIRLDGRPARIAGVLPPEFHFDYPSLRIPEPVDIYVSFPLETPAEFVRASAGVPARVFARLRNGVNGSQAKSDLESIAQALVGEYPAAFRTREGKPGNLTFTMLPLRDAIVGEQRSLLWLLSGGAGILLLIACANAAQLLLARSIRREREVAVRIALGAGRMRLIRQFFLEGLCLAAIGGAAGLILSGWISRALVAWLPASSPLLASAHSDLRTAAFVLAVSVISTIAFATIPAIKASAWAPGPWLQARTAAGERNRWRQAMVALEAALSVFLLCGAALVAQNLWTLISSPMGFDPNHVLVMRLKLPAPDASGSKSSTPFGEYLAKIAAIPGVESAATVSGPPLRPAVSGPSELVGVTESDGRLKSVIGDLHIVSRSYFHTLRIPLLAGRMFREGDETEPWRVVIVNQEFARRFGFGRDVVGKQIFDPTQPETIVGMVANVRTRGLESAPFPEVYVPSLQFSWTNQYLAVRSAVPPAQLVKEVKAAIRSSNPDQAVYGVMTANELIADSISEPRFQALIAGAFALLALAMAATGMYSVISFLVSQRTAEIAIRMALGAGRRAIIRTILGKTMLWVSAGLAAGLVLGIAAMRTIRSLTDTEATGSPEMYAAVILFFFAVTCAAAYVPIQRAFHLDPAAALHSE
ncbi:MAG TPA: ABC transporter permease [Bryobacteraceae bacterium]|nr:ABC transporter permease [Bryobacteraceae bacterium]